MAADRHPQLRADCAQCCGLCCVAPAFDADQGFGFNKPAHEPCPNLRGDFRCRIHSELKFRGFPACATFDCYGAGQRVTQHLFGGKSWKSSPDLAVQMFDAYYRYRILHELMAMLTLALERASSSDALWFRERCQYIDEICHTGEALTATVSVDTLRRTVLSRVRAVLPSVGYGPAVEQRR